MTKHEADKMLMKHYEELDRRADKAQDDEAYMPLVDSMLKIYNYLGATDGFDSDVKTPSGTNGVAM